MDICEEQTTKRERERSNWKMKICKSNTELLVARTNWDCADSIRLAIGISACNSLDKKNTNG